jgi:hypothetical protein
MKLFHGTSIRFFDSILDQGIRLGNGETTSKHQYDDTAKVVSNCLGRVFFANNLDSAAHAGLSALDAEDDRVVILEVDIPDYAAIKKDLVELGCFYTKYPIPSDWIVKAYILRIEELTFDTQWWHYDEI